MKELREDMIKQKVERVQARKDNGKMYGALEELREVGEPRQKLFVNDSKGNRIFDDIEAAEYVRNHIISQFSDVSKPNIEAHEGEPRPLDKPIFPSEVSRAINKLKNRKAVGLDGICAELVKNALPIIQ